MDEKLLVRKRDLTKMDFEQRRNLLINITENCLSEFIDKSNK